jgi:hypothetical protein
LDFGWEDDSNWRFHVNRKAIRLRAARLRRDESAFALNGYGVASGELLVTGGGRKVGKMKWRLEAGLSSLDAFVIVSRADWDNYLANVPDVQPLPGDEI